MQSPLSAPAVPSMAEDAAAYEKSRQKLATLLEVSKGLGKAADIDSLLDKIAGYAYQILEVDRVAILLTDENGELVPKFARDKRGGDTTRAVPQSIARTALKDKVAILSDNAGEDTRFGGQSILMQQIRSAICCPLVGSEDRALGILYVDNVTATHRLVDEDFEFCIAFAGIAAVAIENGQFAQRIQREALARSNFERFFTPQLAKRIAESSETIRLGGDKRPVAVLFSDIRGFTALSENMRSDEIASLLTEYFTEMVECVFRHDGTLDKFIGDSVMAQWGAPIGGPDDADKAMAASIDMMRELDVLNAEWRAAGRPELDIGIGLNFGEAFAGNIGSERRLEFTVIGDTVNTAHRLCSAAGVREILLSRGVPRGAHQPAHARALPADGAQEQESAGDGVSRRAGMMAARDSLPPGFVRVTTDRAELVCAAPLETPLRSIVAAGTLYEFAKARPQARALAGRAPVYAIPLDATGDRLVVRHNHHGGAFAPLTRDLFRAPGRAPLELQISERLRALGVPTPPVLAYAIYTAPIGLCRSDVATMEIADSFDLAAALLLDDRALRDRAWVAAARLVAQLSAAGARHHDLNVKNVLLRATPGGELDAFVLDVDRVTFGGEPRAIAAANVARLARSARKWRDLHGARVAEASSRRSSTAPASSWRQQALVHLERAVTRSLDRVLRRAPAPSRHERRRERRVAKHAHDRRAECLGVADRRKEPGDAVFYNFRYAAPRGRHDRDAERERVHHDERQPLEGRAEGEHRRGRHQLVDVGAKAGEAHDVAEIACCNFPLHRGAQLAVARPERLRTGHRVPHDTHGADEGDRILLRHERAHRDDERRRRAHAERVERFARRCLRIALQLDAARNHFDGHAHDVRRREGVGRGARHRDHRVGAAVLPTRADVRTRRAR